MSVTRRRFSQEFKDELCREVIATSKPINDVAHAYALDLQTTLMWSPPNGWSLQADPDENFNKLPKRGYC